MLLKKKIKKYGWWGILLIPVIALMIFKDVLLKILVSRTNKDLKDTRDKDRKLLEAHRDAQDEADKLEKKVAKKEKKIKERNEGEGDEDWHKKL